MCAGLYGHPVLLARASAYASHTNNDNLQTSYWMCIAMQNLFYCILQ